MVERSFSGTLLRFHALGVPVRVELSFLIMTFLLGSSRRSSPEKLLSWLFVVFVSVLVHELGHALVGRRFGLAPAVRLYGWGGLTSFTGALWLSRSRRLAIALAGPAVGIVFGVLCWLVKSRVPASAAWAQHLLTDFFYASAVWGCVNLVPILPLDGGLAFEAILGMITPRHEAQGARLVSAITGIGVGAFALHHRWAMMGVVGLWLGIDNVRALVRARREARDEEVIARYRPVFSKLIDERDGTALSATAEAALGETSSDRGRTWALENLAVGRVLAGALDEAVAALAHASPAQPPSATIEGFVVRAVVTRRKLDLAGTDAAASSQDDDDTWVRAVKVLRAPVGDDIDAVSFGRIREAAEILLADGEAARIGEALLERAPDPDLAFAVASAWGRAGDAARAVRIAMQAVALGFRDWDRVAAQPELVRRAFAEAQPSGEG
ncbi:Hypothetical protein A7982_09005 [Minicystis rosea]|nr:Hypothetical protein A7982_09005 [Minicystis rosea]